MLPFTILRAADLKTFGSRTHLRACTSRQPTFHNIESCRSKDFRVKDAPEGLHISTAQNSVYERKLSWEKENSTDNWLDDTNWQYSKKKVMATKLAVRQNKNDDHVMLSRNSLLACMSPVSRETCRFWFARVCGCLLVCFDFM